MDKLYASIVAGKQKAVVGFVVAVIIAYFAKFGFDLSTLTVADALQLLLSGLVGYVSVYVKKNQ